MVDESYSGEQAKELLVNFQLEYYLPSIFLLDLFPTQPNSQFWLREPTANSTLDRRNYAMSLAGDRLFHFPPCGTNAWLFSPDGKRVKRVRKEGEQPFVFFCREDLSHNRLVLAKPAPGMLRVPRTTS